MWNPAPSPAEWADGHIREPVHNLLYWFAGLVLPWFAIPFYLDLQGDRDYFVAGVPSWAATCVVVLFVSHMAQAGVCFLGWTTELRSANLLVSCTSGKKSSARTTHTRKKSKAQSSSSSKFWRDRLRHSIDGSILGLSRHRRGNKNEEKVIVLCAPEEASRKAGIYGVCFEHNPTSFELLDLSNGSSEELRRAYPEARSLQGKLPVIAEENSPQSSAGLGKNVSP